MHWLDWSIVIIALVGLYGFAFIYKRYTVSVADFLVANRCGGRYLLSLAEGAAGLGIITLVAYWQMYYEAGFSALWWQSVNIPVGLIITCSGWVVYRFRQTRAMTLAQFFEMRYSRNFRIFSGMLAWFSGVINYGIFPAITAKCLIYFCGFPIWSVNWLGLELNVTLGIVMFIMLAFAVVFTIIGGQISIMITDFAQGQFFNISFLLLLLIIIPTVQWHQVVDTLKQAPEQASMINPFKQGDIPNFDMWYFLIGAVLAFYGTRAWQGSQAISCSAKSAHEQKMAGILGGWRKNVVSLMYVVAPIFIFVILHSGSPEFRQVADNINALLANIPAGQDREQMTTPLGLAQLLPTGMVGVLALALVFAAVSTDTTSLHSWGSIFIQDIVMPLRKNKPAPRQHLQWLRYSIIGVAAFAWVFSMLFPLKEAILLYFMITGAIYLGGAGAVIIGGLYWRRGTTAGAWAGMISGAMLACSTIVLRNILWPKLPAIRESHPDWTFLSSLPDEFWLSSAECSFLSAVAACFIYTMVSLVTRPKAGFEMDQMLHRGRYAIAGEKEIVRQPTLREKIFGITGEFTTHDKIIYYASVGLSLFWFFAFVIGTPLYLIFGASDDIWAGWWLFKMVLTAVLALFTTIWFLWGGTADIIDLIRRLKTAKRDAADNGSVSTPPAGIEQESSTDTTSTQQRAK